MQTEIETTPVEAKMPYETPVLTMEGPLEVLTQQDVDGAHFDANFNEGDPIPPNFAS